MKEIITLFLLSTLTLGAQSGIVVSSGDISEDEIGSVSYSIGQIFYQSYRDGPDGLQMNEGLQQPFEFELITLKEDDPEIELITRALSTKDPALHEDIEISLYPNPFSNHVNVELTQLEDKVDCYVLDGLGRLILKKQLTDLSTRIDLLDFPSGIFYLTLVQNETPIKSIKLIKQQ